MRDPARIWRINNKINVIWLTYPDLRLLQLMEAIKGTHVNRTGAKTPVDFFFVEDESLELTLDQIIEKGFKI